MKVAVVGTGYVGLVVGTCFAETGHNVISVDSDRAKIEGLKAGKLPIYEPGLEDLVVSNQKEGRLVFSTALPEAVAQSEIVFLTVGTPSREGGSVDLTYVLGVAKEVALAMNEPKIVVIKSTTPCGTARKVEEVLRANTKHSFDVVVNPEFLKEGVAVDDFLRPDRVVIGVAHERLKSTFRRLYEPFLRTGKPIIFMSRESAEMTKYAANGLLALRISYINEIANLCERMGADVDSVRKGVGADARIGHSFLFPGAGYGGSCFPKDVDGLVHTAESAGLSLRTLAAAQEVNRRQPLRLTAKLREMLQAAGRGKLDGVSVALWGLAFKPRTDDMREAPALAILEDLLAAKAKVRVFDPVAMDAAKRLFAEHGWNNVHLAESAYDAVKGVDALLLVTEWNEFRRPDWKKVKSTMSGNIVIDGRNIFDPADVVQAGFQYSGIGRSHLPEIES